MNKFTDVTYEEIRLSSPAVFYCSYCGERLNKSEPVILRQDRHNFTEILHKECQH